MLPMIRSFAGVAVIALWGCSDSTSPAAPGSMHFQYSGDQSASYNGTFDANGSLNPDSQSDQTGAIAQRGAGRIDVLGARATPFQEFEFVLVGVTAAGPLTTCQERTTNCVYQGHFWPSVNDIHYFGWGVLGNPPYPELSVTVTELTGSRIRGTFSGIVVGSCATCTNGQDTLTITGGAFDVPFWK